MNAKRSESSEDIMGWGSPLSGTSISKQTTNLDFLDDDVLEEGPAELIKFGEEINVLHRSTSKNTESHLSMEQEKRLNNQNVDLNGVKHLKDSSLQNDKDEERLNSQNVDLNGVKHLKNHSIQNDKDEERFNSQNLDLSKNMKDSLLQNDKDQHEERLSNQNVALNGVEHLKDHSIQNDKDEERLNNRDVDLCKNMKDHSLQNDKNQTVGSNHIKYDNNILFQDSEDIDEFLFNKEEETNDHLNITDLTTKQINNLNKINEGVNECFFSKEEETNNEANLENIPVAKTNNPERINKDNNIFINQKGKNLLINIFEDEDNDLFFENENNLLKEDLKDDEFDENMAVSNINKKGLNDEHFNSNMIKNQNIMADNNLNINSIADNNLNINLIADNIKTNETCYRNSRFFTISKQFIISISSFYDSSRNTIISKSKAFNISVPEISIKSFSETSKNILLNDNADIDRMVEKRNIFKNGFFISENNFESLITVNECMVLRYLMVKDCLSDASKKELLKGINFKEGNFYQVEAWNDDLLIRKFILSQKRKVLLLILFIKRNKIKTLGLENYFKNNIYYKFIFELLKEDKYSGRNGKHQVMQNNTIDFHNEDAYDLSNENYQRMQNNIDQSICENISKQSNDNNISNQSNDNYQVAQNNINEYNCSEYSCSQFKDNHQIRCDNTDTLFPEDDKDNYQDNANSLVSEDYNNINDNYQDNANSLVSEDYNDNYSYQNNANNLIAEDYNHNYQGMQDNTVDSIMEDCKMNDANNVEFNENNKIIQDDVSHSINKANINVQDNFNPVDDKKFINDKELNNVNNFLYSDAGYKDNKANISNKSCFDESNMEKDSIISQFDSEMSTDNNFDYIFNQNKEPDDIPAGSAQIESNLFSESADYNANSNLNNHSECIEFLAEADSKPIAEDGDIINSLNNLNISSKRILPVNGQNAIPENGDILNPMSNLNISSKKTLSDNEEKIDQLNGKKQQSIFEDSDSFSFENEDSHKNTNANNDNEINSRADNDNEIISNENSDNEVNSNANNDNEIISKVDNDSEIISKVDNDSEIISKVDNDSEINTNENNDNEINSREDNDNKMDSNNIKDVIVAKEDDTKSSNIIMETLSERKSNDASILKENCKQVVNEIEQNEDVLDSKDELYINNLHSKSSGSLNDVNQEQILYKKKFSKSFADIFSLDGKNELDNNPDISSYVDDSRDDKNILKSMEEESKGVISSFFDIFKRKPASSVSPKTQDGLANRFNRPPTADIKQPGKNRIVSHNLYANKKTGDNSEIPGFKSFRK